MRFYNFMNVVAWTIGIVFLFVILWLVHLVAGWWGVAVLAGIMAFIGWAERPASNGDYHIPTEEITIIDKNGNSKTYRKK